ncbi:hypothetical protein EBT31_15040 [bacterium]|jgi:uncharacterized protein (DUF4415 family)|nr:hypothetical protein [bacterium]
MTDTIETNEGAPTNKRRGRGPGKRPALVVTSLRLPKDVMEYFNTHYPHKKQAKMREVLSNFVNQQGAQNG